MKLFHNSTLPLILFIAFLIGVNGRSARSQTTGLIYESANTAGSAVMDPNGDGYSSKTTEGFGASDRINSELPYVTIPVLSAEPTGDLARGPACGFTDFTDSSNYPVAVHYDGVNLLIRFRLAGTSTNSKGYSMLIDADSRFGFTGPNADPNAVVGNPGFEFEIVLETNFGVRLNTMDGSATATSRVLLPIGQYHQKSIAANTISPCGTAYFYDFYMPFSQITTHTGYTASTPFRYVFNTVMAPTGAFKGPISDIGGVNDANYSTPSKAWEALIGNMTPTATNDIDNGILQRTPTPTVTGPIPNGATSISGTATSAGTLILYRIRGGTVTAIDTVMVSGAGPSYSWTANSLSGTVQTGDYIYSTLTATGMGTSGSSNRVLVQSCVPLSGITVTSWLCKSSKAVGGRVSGVPVGTRFKLYSTEGELTSGGIYTVNSNTATGDPNFVYNCNGPTILSCTQGSPCAVAIKDLTYWVTFVNASGCETAPVSFNNNGCVSETPAPVISTAISSATTTISGTSVAGAIVRLYVNGYQRATTTAGSTSPFGYSFTGLTLATGDVITVRSKQGNSCLSDAASPPTDAPIITSTPQAGGTSLSGTSTEAAGTTIRVYNNATNALLGTTTVAANGTWTLTGMTAFTAAQVFYATAQATNENISAKSNTVTVSAVPSTVTPTITTTSPIEGTTSISGTLSSGITAGDRIILYLDGLAIDTSTALTSGATSWAISTLSATRASTKYLYSGGVLTARVLRTGTTVPGTVASNSVTVLCVEPSSTPVVTGASARVCQNDSDTIFVDPSEDGIVYTLLDSATDAIIGPSQVGNGTTLILPTYAFISPGAQTIQVVAERIGEDNCEVVLANVASNEVDERPVANAGADQSNICDSVATLSATAANVGTAVWTVLSGSATVVSTSSPSSAVTTLSLGDNVLVWTITNNSCIESDTVVLTRDCPTIYTVRTYSAGYAFQIGDTLATAFDEDGIVSASYTGTLPSGTEYRTSAPSIGFVLVNDPSALQTGSWTITSITEDANGNISSDEVEMSLDNPSSLPVELLSFTAKHEGEIVRLDWVTASEESNARFEIERSAEGIDFAQIMTVPGAGNSERLLQYEAIDEKPLMGHSYYRLKQVDYNNEFAYSEIVKVSSRGLIPVQPRLDYPNPTEGSDVNIVVTEFYSSTAIINIYDPKGAKVFQRSVRMEEGKLNMRLPLSENFVSGIYKIQIISDSGILTKRLIIK